MFDSHQLTENALPEVGQYAVFGSPISHSLSPRIHQHFAEQLGIALQYRAIEVPAGELASALATFAANGGQGASISLPHKAAAFALCKTLADKAQRVGVVNTLKRMEDGWFGDNTDGSGLIADLAERHRIDLRGRRVLMLGAGGAAKGVLPALLDAGIESVTICNRTPERADALSDWIGKPGLIHTLYWDDLKIAGGFDFIINATSAGHGVSMLNLPFGIAGQRTLAYDLNYGTAALAFLAWARAANCEFALDGLGMLVEQAADAFAIWHGQRPDTETIYSQLRKEQSGHER